MSLKILHTNDFHGTLTPEIANWIRAQKTPDTLYLDSGDFIRAGNLSIPLRPEPAWELLDQAGCDFGTLGNRESHPLESGQLAKLAGRKHSVLCANMRTKSGELVFPASAIVSRAGLKIGILGVMVPMVTARMASAALSAYLWDAPIPAAVTIARELRPEVDVVIAITHIGFKNDQLLAETCPEIDLIFGGHSHTVLQEPSQVGKTAIMQGGSHGKFLGVYEWTDGKISGGLTATSVN